MKKGPIILGAGITLGACHMPDYFRDPTERQREVLGQNLTELEVTFPVMEDFITASPVVLVDAHANSCSDHNQELIVDYRASLDGLNNLYDEYSIYIYDRADYPECSDSAGVNYQYPGHGVDNDYVGLTAELFVEIDEEGVNSIPSTAVHEYFHSMAWSADNHDEELEERARLDGEQHEDRLVLALEFGDPAHEIGALVAQIHEPMYYPAFSLYRRYHEAVQEYNESLGDRSPQFIYNRFVGGKKTEQELQECIIQDLKRSPVVDTLGLDEGFVERSLSRWFHSEYWDYYMEDYNYHYDYLMSEIVNGFEDHEIMTREERAEREENAVKAREAKESRSTDLGAHSPRYRK